MKKLLLLGVASLSALTGFSQIVLEAVDFPVAGDSIYQGIDTLIPLSITPGGAGADQTWDFSQLRTRQGSTIHFADPSTLSSGSSFPNAFLAVEQFGGWGFADSSNGTVEITGFAGDFTGLGADMDIPFQDPQTIFVFPSTYLSSYIDTAIIDVRMEAPAALVAQSPIPIDSIHFKRYSEIQSEIDGYGDVITPIGTYDALRQRNVEHNIDSIWIYAQLLGGWGLLPGQLIGFENPRVSDVHRYNYIIKEIGYYAVSLTANTNDSIERATFVSDPSLCCFGAGVEETDIAEAFSIYPNPASNGFSIRTDTQDKLVYAVYDVTGKQVLTGSLNSTVTFVNSAALASGLYVCKVFSADGRLAGSQKISISGN
ncbi:MAG: hypothetical protein POELPBGB_03688 [Bacteroidia bacterium]|nr:hypothetical protein [Bacteroidia bacterium]